MGLDVRAAVLVLLVTTCQAGAALAQEPRGIDWILVADKLALLQKYVEGSALDSMKDQNLRARLTAHETTAVLLASPTPGSLYQVLINVRSSTRVNALNVPREDYEALQKFASDTALH